MTDQPFVPTHVVPEQGLDAYVGADASGAPAARLDPWLEVALRQRVGDWAEVQCSNGWVCWVDARWLAQKGAPATQRVGSYREMYTRAHPAGRSPTSVAAAAAAGAPAGRPSLTLPLIGAALVAVGAFLPWLTFPLSPSFSSTDLPIQFLFDTQPSPDSPIDIVVLLLVAAGIGVAASFRPSMTKIRKGAGWGAVVITTLYVANLQRLLGEMGEGAPGLIEALGFGVLVTVAGGVLMGVAPDKVVVAGTSGSSGQAPT